MSLIVFFYSRRRSKFNSLFEILKYFNEDRHREARRVLYRTDGSKDNLNNEGNFLSSHIILGFHAVANGYDLERVCKSIV